MEPILEILIRELSDNWPAFIYIGLMIGFSVLFFRERRAETDALKQIGTGLQDRIDKLERTVRDYCGRES